MTNCPTDLTPGFVVRLVTGFRHDVVGGGHVGGKILARRLLAALAQLVLDRPIALVLGGIAGVKSDTDLLGCSYPTGQAPSLQGVGFAYSRIARWKVLGIAGHKQVAGGLRRGPDHRVREFDAMGSPQSRRTVGDLIIQRYDPEALEEKAGRLDQISVSPHHHLHPGDDADGPVLEALDFRAGLGDGVQVIDEDIGVKQRAYHSRRTFC